MASVLQVATIKDQGGNNNAIEIANTSANVTINNLAGGSIGSAVTGGSGLTEHGRIGKICWVTKQTISNNVSGSGRIGTLDSDGWNTMVNSDSNMYSISNAGITVALAGTYLAVYGVYLYDQSSTGGYMEVQISRKPSGGSFGQLSRTYQITNNATGGDSSQYHNYLSSAIISLNANDLVDLYFNRSSGTYTVNAANTNLRLVYLDSNTFSM